MIKRLARLARRALARPERDTRLDEVVRLLAEGLEEARSIRASLGAQHSTIDELYLYQRWRELGEERLFRFQYDGYYVSLFLPQGPPDYIESEILRERTFYNAKTLQYLRESVNFVGKTVLNIGANIGNHTVYFAKASSAANIHCFEPMDKSFRALVRNIDINQINAVAHNMGIGAVESRGHSMINPRNAGGSGLSLHNGDIRIAPLDALDIGPFDIMKIDVEEMALSVLQGAKAAIQANHPTIIVEMNEEGDEIGAFLAGLGYRFQSSYEQDSIFVAS